MTTSTVADVGADNGCGDGVPEPGVYCFVPHEAPELRSPDGARVVADFDGDGHPELALTAVVPPGDARRTVFARWNGGLEIVAHGSPTHEHRSPGRPEVGGPLTFVFIQSNDTARRVWLEGGQIVSDMFTLPPISGAPEIGATFGFVTLIDLDGSGADELIVAEYLGGEEGWHWHGFGFTRGSWTPVEPQLFKYETPPSHATTADVDGDGRRELIFASETSNEVFVLGGGPEGLEVLWRGEPEHVPTTGVQPPEVADLDHDGFLDIVVRGGGDLSVIHGRGDGTFDAPQRLELPGYGASSNGRTTQGVRRVTTGDFDGDGGSELAALLTVPDTDTLTHLVVVDDPFADPSVKLLLSYELGQSSLAAGDLNEDGVDDLFLGIGPVDERIHLTLLSDP